MLSASSEEIYFIGIIDHLTEYNLKKKSEHTLKSLVHDSVRKREMKQTRDTDTDKDREREEKGGNDQSLILLFSFRRVSLPFLPFPIVDAFKSTSRQ